MVDKLTTEQRRHNMSRIKGRDTKPEMIVRRRLWAEGYRYRLYVKGIPGRPDIVMAKYKIAIFINGCFWHGHQVERDHNYDLIDSKCCRIPHTNRDFWVKKIARNMERDSINYQVLKMAGWHVLVVWECQLKGKEQQELTLRALSCQLSSLILDAYHRPKSYGIEDSPSVAIAAEDTVNYSK